MAAPGLSLVGFLDLPDALNHLRHSCVPSDGSDAALTAEWQAAKTALGAPIAGAGLPEVQDISPAQRPYVAGLVSQPWVGQMIGAMPGMQFKLVEIDRLLTFQRLADDGRLNEHGNSLGDVSEIDKLIRLCLPQTQTVLKIEAYWNAQSVMLKAPGLNLRAIKDGLLDPGRVGLSFGPAPPLVQVHRFNGRYFLHNGLHRAIVARRAGATHIPCVVREVPNAAAVGICTDGSTFSQALLESPNPPTVGHFTQSRAHPVQVRSVSRVLHVSWSEYAVLDE
jgi:hypothetical protein